MKNEWMFGAGGLLAGVVIAVVVAAVAVNSNNQAMMNMMGMHASSSGDMSMNGMISDLQGKTGDDFDKAFLANMIEHHQGAIDMAKLAEDNAKHQEVKDLANNILSTRSKEIDQMQTWQGEWGYKYVPTSHDMSH